MVYRTIDAVGDLEEPIRRLAVEEPPEKGYPLPFPVAIAAAAAVSGGLPAGPLAPRGPGPADRALAGGQPACPWRRQRSGPVLPPATDPTPAPTRQRLLPRTPAGSGAPPARRAPSRIAGGGGQCRGGIRPARVSPSSRNFCFLGFFALQFFFWVFEVAEKEAEGAREEGGGRKTEGRR